MDKFNPYNPREITEEEARSILLVGLPLGLYYYWDTDNLCYVGIESSKEHVITAHFEYLRFCLNWFNRLAGAAFYRATRLYAKVESGYIGYEARLDNSLKEVCHFSNYPDCCKWIAEQEFAPAYVSQY